MRKVEWSKRFDKSYKRCKKRGYNMTLLDDLLILMASRDFTDEEIYRHKVHKLSGKHTGYWELHVTNGSDNWLLKYKVNGNTLVFEETEVYLDDTGTHADVLGYDSQDDILIWL